MSKIGRKKVVYLLFGSKYSNFLFLLTFFFNANKWDKLAAQRFCVLLILLSILTNYDLITTLFDQSTSSICNLPWTILLFGFDSDVLLVADSVLNMWSTSTLKAWVRKTRVNRLHIIVDQLVSSTKPSGELSLLKTNS